MDKIRKVLDAHAASATPEEQVLFGIAGIRVSLGDLKELFLRAEALEARADQSAEVEAADAGPRLRAPAGRRA